MTDTYGSVCHYFLAIVLERNSRGKEGAKVSSVHIANRFGRYSISVDDVHDTVCNINIKLLSLKLSPIDIYSVEGEERYQIHDDYKNIVTWRI